MSEKLTAARAAKGSNSPEAAPNPVQANVFAWSDRFVQRHIGPNAAEVDAAVDDLARFYLDRLTQCARDWHDRWRRDLIGAFAELQERGVIEIITCAATHGFLPLLGVTPGAVRAQIEVGVAEYRRFFGRGPDGFWLPECAYAPGLEPLLQEANVRWLVLDAHGLLFGKPRPRRSIYAPCYTPSGPAAFARDPDASRQVWSAHEGYPGDPAYREFYRDVGFDLSMRHLGPVARGTRKFSGVKYHRITGCGNEKELYDRAAAKHAAAKHATHFLKQRWQQIREISEFGFDPIIVAPFDAELFGHWWFEGPVFLEEFIRRTANERKFSLTTPSEYLATHPTEQIIEPAASTWGENGHLAVWLDKSNAWIYSHLHAAAQKMTAIAKDASAVVGQPPQLPNRKSAGGAPALQMEDRVLKQLARELLLAQASDWAFLMKANTAREYATKRMMDHLARFTRLHDQFVANAIDEEFLRDCEWRDNIFPNLSWRYYV